MNYRLLFIISFLILGVGVVGLLFLGKDDRPEVVQQVLTPKVVYKDVVLTTATATRDIPKGTLIQPSDYKITNETLKLKEGDDNSTATPSLAFNLRQTIADGGTGSLLGFLAQENITKGSIIDPNSILSPKAENYILASLDPDTQLAYVLPINARNTFLLTTLKAGSKVSLYANFSEISPEQESPKGDLVKVVDYVTVLKVNPPQKDKDQDQQSLGNIILKLSAKDLKNLYQLPRDIMLLPLPAKEPQPIDSRGLLIRQLRG